MKTTGESGPRKAETKSEAKPTGVASGGDAEDKLIEKAEESEVESSGATRKAVETGAPDVMSSASATDVTATPVSGVAKEKEDAAKAVNQESKDGKLPASSSGQHQQREIKERFHRERRDRPRRPPSPHRPRQQVLTFQHIRVL